MQPTLKTHREAAKKLLFSGRAAKWGGGGWVMDRRYQ